MFSLLTNENNVVIFGNGTIRLRIGFVSQTIARITLTDYAKPFQDQQSFIVEKQRSLEKLNLKQNSTDFTISTSKLNLIVNKQTGQITYQHANGKILLRELDNGGKWLMSKKIYSSRANRDVFEAKLELNFDENEALFGFGCHDEAYGNLRGKSLEFYQHPTKIICPYFVSTLNYGVLFDCYSLMTFHDDHHGSYIWCDIVEQFDYYFICGNDFQDLTSSFYSLTGQCSLLPKSAFGLIQSKENSNEIFSTIELYRRQQIPIDVIISNANQDLANQLHSMKTKLILSISSKIDQKHLTLDDNLTLNVYSNSSNEFFEKKIRENICIDGWSCVDNQPFADDYSIGLEPHLRLIVNVEKCKRYIDPGLINSYSLLQSKSIYENHRKQMKNKRLMLVSGSSYSGQHRYGTIVSKKPIQLTWQTFRRCIPQGFHCSASGQPFWSMTIQENRLNQSNNELYLRWFQFLTFTPIFHINEKQISSFGRPGSEFYENVLKSIHLRYQLIPYIYSFVGQIRLNGSMLIRPIAFDYPNDRNTFDLIDQYLFGSAFLVCPVTKATVQCRSVYLPSGNQWFDFWNETFYDGQQTISVYSPLNIIPLFVKAGSIIPMTQSMQYVDQIVDAPYQIRIYRGNSTQFTIYEDAGDNYEYENGQFSLIDLIWNENRSELTISDRRGSFPQLIQQRDFHLICISKQRRITKTIRYSGKQIQLSF